MYASRITAPTPPIPQQEDIFSSALHNLFTDDVQNSHGVPGSHVTYHSPHFGKIELKIPRHPDVEEGRKLFAHYLWNAGVICADAVEEASWDEKEDDGQPQKGEGVKGEENEIGAGWNRQHWDVRGKRVLELGAGTALPSIISALSGAASTTVTDHSSSPALTTGAIEHNIRVSVLKRHKCQRPDADNNDFEPESAISCDACPEINIFGYTWGTTTFYDPAGYGKPAQQGPTKFDRIIIADCLWMPSQHVNIVTTVLQYLDDSNTEKESCALVVAGFHTGRETVRQFFEIATGDDRLPALDSKDSEDLDPETGLETSIGKGRDTATEQARGLLRATEMFEVDVDGLRRPWEPDRPRESKEAAKRWCVVAVLVRK